MKYKLKVSTIWEFGQRKDANGHPHQEDSIYPLNSATDKSGGLYILCDGVGGHEAGEVASRTVCETMSRTVESHTSDDFTADDFKDALKAAYDALDTIGSNGNGPRKMATTMTFLKFHSQGCLIAHIGDSRVYHIRPGKTADRTRILFRTTDHSLINDLIKAGELTPAEAELSKQKNVITRAMQPCMENRPKADIYQTSDIQAGDYFYMCSDGMLENMNDKQLCYHFSTKAGEDKARNLTLATTESQDNHSAIIIKVVAAKDMTALFKAIACILCICAALALIWYLW